jgi:hypothetical protein
MSQLSYGLETPEDILAKLTSDAGKLTRTPHAYDVFNFMVTAAVLNEWVVKYYRPHPIVAAIEQASERRDSSLLPSEAATWIPDQSCLPNRHCDVRRHIHNAMRICWETANASKHYHWQGNRIKAIEAAPIVGNWYQYFFTSREPDLYIDYEGECYGLLQLRGILLQFYTGLLGHMHADQTSVSSSSEAEPCGQPDLAHKAAQGRLP